MSDEINEFWVKKVEQLRKNVQRSENLQRLVKQSPGWCWQSTSHQWRLDELWKNRGDMDEDVFIGTPPVAALLEEYAEWLGDQH